jgi:DNA gyrase subunit B
MFGPATQEGSDVMTSYRCEDIQVLTAVQAIRKRPGMYIGDCDARGIHHMLDELVAEVLEQHQRGQVGELRVELADGWIVVRDDGPGISPHPVTPDERRRTPGVMGHYAMPPEGLSALEALFTTLHYRRRRDHYPCAPFGGAMFGNTPVVVTALAERLVVETTHAGVRWAQAFERGEAVTAVRRLGPTSLVGTTVRFRPDPMIFGTATLDRDAVRTRLAELAWLFPHLRVWHDERRLPMRGGLAGWARTLARPRGDIECAFTVTQIVGDVSVDLALAWNDAGSLDLRSFVNLERRASGSQVDGLWQGLLAYARSRGAPVRTVDHVREAVSRGLVAIVSVSVSDYRSDWTRQHVTSEPAAAAVRAAIMASAGNNNGYSHRVRRFLDERLLVPAAR